MTFVSAILIIYISYVILRKAENLKKQRSIQAIFIRAVALIVALVVSIPCLAILAAQVYIFGWVGTFSVNEIWPTEYRHNMGINLSLLFLMFLCSLLFPLHLFPLFIRFSTN